VPAPSRFSSHQPSEKEIEDSWRRRFHELTCYWLRRSAKSRQSRCEPGHEHRSCGQAVAASVDLQL
jgi:hypothetical protein